MFAYLIKLIFLLFRNCPFSEPTLSNVLFAKADGLEGGKHHQQQRKFSVNKQTILGHKQTTVENKQTIIGDKPTSAAKQKKEDGKPDSWIISGYWPLRTKWWWDHHHHHHCHVIIAVIIIVMIIVIIVIFDHCHRWPTNTCVNDCKQPW